MKQHQGFSIIEILIVLGIMAILTGITFSVFSSVKKAQALEKDRDSIIEVLRQARSQTLSSKNASQYGVHITSSQITLFTGTSYSVGNSSNQDFILQGSDTIVTISLTGGGSDVVFNRLTGETNQNGTITISSPSTSQTKTVTIYKTGLVE